MPTARANWSKTLTTRLSRLLAFLVKASVSGSLACHRVQAKETADEGRPPRGECMIRITHPGPVQPGLAFM